MASRSFYRNVNCQGNGYVFLPFTLQGNGTGAPSVGEGDAGNSYVTVAREDVGVYSVTTVDPYVAVVAAQATLTLDTPEAAGPVFDVPSQNGDGTWTMNMYVFNDAGSALELSATDGAFVTLVLRNSSVTP